jgi:hypothetical protein
MQWRLNACRSQCTSAVPAPLAATPRTFGQPLTNSSTVPFTCAHCCELDSVGRPALLDQNDSILIDVRARADRGTRYQPHPVGTQSRCTCYLPSCCPTTSLTPTPLHTYTRKFYEFLVSTLELLIAFYNQSLLMP